MKDIRGNNGDREVYGFIKKGDYWRIFRYDDVSFWRSPKMDVLFFGMENEEKE
ncbi:hypothetical protein BDZ91DRAFT_745682 [Kalaharituber pfeilii]|nr:hypothetical protein BDZ91DRAFT_745682 [Kalaharituber pfeilii]